MDKAAEYDDVVPSFLTPPLGILVSGHYQCQFGYRTLRPSGAGSWLLMFTLGGEGLIRQPGEPGGPGAGVQKRVRAGDVDLLSPEAYSDYGVPSSGASWDFHWIHFQSFGNMLNTMDLPLASSGNGLGRGWYRMHLENVSVRQRMDLAFERIHRDLMASELAGIASAQSDRWDLGGEDAQQLAASALHEILLLIGRELGLAQKRIDPRIVQALGLIQDHLHHPLCVAELARAVGLSPSRFAHLFKVQTGRSVTQTIIGLRISQAQRLLRYTQDSVSEIAYRLGFTSPFYFSRLFSTVVGQSPKAYRQAQHARNHAAFFEC